MKSILLIGIGEFGAHIAMQLNQLGHEVMAVDIVEEKINEILPYVTNAQIGDSANINFLSSLGVKNFDVCIVTIDSDFQSSLETTANLKDLGATMVVSRAGSDSQAKFLLRNGADEILYPKKQMARWAAMRYGANHILDYIELDETHAILEVSVPKDWISKSILELDIRKKYNINILGTKKYGIINLTITPDTVLTDDITMLVLGEYKTLQKCFRI